MWSIIGLVTANCTMDCTALCSNVKSMPYRLTTSSYAVLCLLAIRPWSGYELTQQATRSLRFAWPKSERLLYSEPKKLVEHEMATAHTNRSASAIAPSTRSPRKVVRR